MATRKKAPAGEMVDVPPMGAGHPKEDQESVGIRVRTDRSGLRHAVILPRSLQKLEGAAFDAISELQHLAGSMQQIRQDIDLGVIEAREAGASWGAIGWSLGMTPQSARERWRG